MLAQPFGLTPALFSVALSDDVDVYCSWPACFTASMLPFLLPDFEEFKFGQEMSLGRQKGITEVPAGDLDDEPELYTIESAPLINETVPEERERLRKVAIRPDFFISISSYRDENCIQTSTQIFTKCRYCERLRIWSTRFPTTTRRVNCRLNVASDSSRRSTRFDSIFTRLGADIRPLFNISAMSWRIIFLLQIDSHLNFISEWDRRLLDMVPRVPNAIFVISHYPVATLATWRFQADIRSMTMKGSCRSLRSSVLGFYSLPIYHPIPFAHWTCYFMERSSLIQRVSKLARFSRQNRQPCVCPRQEPFVS